VQGFYVKVHPPTVYPWFFLLKPRCQPSMAPPNDLGIAYVCHKKISSKAGCRSFPPKEASLQKFCETNSLQPNKTTMDYETY